MKKILALLLALMMCTVFVACGSSEQNNSEIQTGPADSTSTESVEEPLVVPGPDGIPALNARLVANYMERVELTVDNWQEYLKVYSYDTEIVKKDAFGETASTEVQKVFCLGYGSDRYHSFEAIVELKHKETGETLFASMETGYVFLLASDANLDEYECTRIQGNLYFFNFPEEVMEEVLITHDREAARYTNAEIKIAEGAYAYTWSADTDAKVITDPSGSSWNNYFE